MFTGKQGGRGGDGEEADPKDAGCENRNALGLEKKGGGWLFLGPHNIRWRGPRSTPPFFIPSFPTFLPGMCSRRRGRLCAQNTNKRETAGCWQADVLPPSPVCSPETTESIREAGSASARTDDKLTHLQHELMKKMKDAESKQVEVELSRTQDVKEVELRM